MHGFVEAGIRVEVGAKPDPDGLQIGDDVVLGEPARAVEQHVFDEVRQAFLIVVLEHRSRVDHEPQLESLLRARVLPDVVAESVRQCPRAHGGIQRDQVLLRQATCGTTAVASGRRAVVRARRDGQETRERRSASRNLGGCWSSPKFRAGR
jgi:hypothetical protein